jgi:3-oxoacyl-[acyl-carrier-protein] synthase II
MLVLMRKDLAEQVGAQMLAEVMGYGLSADGYHPTAPHPEGLGASRAIKAALKSAGVPPDAVRYVNSHGTGTPKNDPAETAATKRGLGEAAHKVAVSSTKSMIGHLLGGAGAVEGIITVKALETQIAPPTANYEEPDPECDLDYVPNQSRPLEMDVAISNNFAFGGANATIVLARPQAIKEGPPVPDLDRVVITGMAALTTAGTSLDELWNAFTAGEDRTQREDGARVGRVNLDPSPWLSPRERRRVDRLGIFSVIATKVALQDAGIEIGDENRNRIGVIFGTGVGPMESMEQFSRPLFDEGPAAANPAVFPNTVYNAAPGQVAMQVGTVGPTTTVSVGHAAGASAITYSYDLVSRDQADATVAVAADTLTDTVIEGYKAVGMLSPEKGGMALAEAGVALVLERLEKAQARGAHIYGEILAYGIASDAKGVGQFDPRGFGIERAMRLALERAGLQPDDIKAIWASAAGYRLADGAEQAAIKRVFGDGVKVIAPKVQLGEPIGAGGALDAVLALETWKHGAEDVAAPGPVLVNSSSMGGTHFSMILTPFEG